MTGRRGALSRPVAVHRLPAAGDEVVVEASAQECAALAREFGLVSVESLVGRFRLAHSAGPEPVDLERP